METLFGNNIENGCSFIPDRLHMGTANNYWEMIGSNSNVFVYDRRFPRDRRLPYGDLMGFSRNGSVTMTKREVPKCC